MSASPLRLRLSEGGPLFRDQSGSLFRCQRHSPIQGRLNHAKVCDNEVFVQAPFFQDEKENPIFPVPGDIGYFPVRQTICLWYGPMKPLGPSTVLAKIYPEDLPKFAAEASKVWANQGTMIKLEVVEA